MNHTVRPAGVVVKKNVIGDLLLKDVVMPFMKLTQIGLLLLKVMITMVKKDGKRENLTGGEVC
jgi:hypothetical protein